jgi:tRNA(Ile2) C34 agmatinyltransferase TiaS
MVSPFPLLLLAMLPDAPLAAIDFVGMMIFTVIGVMALAIILVFRRAVAMTKNEVQEQAGSSDPEEVARKSADLTDQWRSLDVRCPRCGRQSVPMLGTNNRYRCESCNKRFDGPPFPGSSS